MPITNTTWKVSCSGTLPHSEIWANIWHIRSISMPSAAFHGPEAEEVAAHFEAFYDGIKELLDPTWALSSINVTDISGTGSDPTYVPVNVVGTGTGGPLPTTAAVVLSLTTATGTRRGRGRIYLGGFAESANNGGSSARLHATARDLIGAEAQALQTALSTNPPNIGPWEVAVFSRMDNESRPVTAFRVGTIFDTQRRRRNRSAEQYVSYTA